MKYWMLCHMKSVSITVFCSLCHSEAIKRHPVPYVQEDPLQCPSPSEENLHAYRIGGGDCCSCGSGEGRASRVSGQVWDYSFLRALLEDTDPISRCAF